MSELEMLRLISELGAHVSVSAVSIVFAWLVWRDRDRWIVMLREDILRLQTRITELENARAADAKTYLDRIDALTERFCDRTDPTEPTRKTARIGGD